MIEYSDRKTGISIHKLPSNKSIRHCAATESCQSYPQWFPFVVLFSRFFWNSLPPQPNCEIAKIWRSASACRIIDNVCDWNFCTLCTNTSVTVTTAKQKTYIMCTCQWL